MSFKEMKSSWWIVKNHSPYEEEKNDWISAAIKQEILSSTPLDDRITTLLHTCEKPTFPIDSVKKHHKYSMLHLKSNRDSFANIGTAKFDIE